MKNKYSRKLTLLRYRTSKKNKAVQSKYRTSEKGRAASRRSYQAYRLRNKAKRDAKDTVNSAVRAGLLPHISSRRCNRCKSKAAHYHHWSYLPEHWLDVEPLCKKCHDLIHKPPGIASDLVVQCGYVRRTVTATTNVADSFGRKGYLGKIVLRLECGHTKNIDGSAVIPRTALCRECVKDANHHAIDTPEAGV